MKAPASCSRWHGAFRCALREWGRRANPSRSITRETTSCRRRSGGIGSQPRPGGVSSPSPPLPRPRDRPAEWPARGFRSRISRSPPGRDYGDQPTNGEIVIRASWLTLPRAARHSRPDAGYPSPGRAWCLAELSRRGSIGARARISGEQAERGAHDRFGFQAADHPDVWN